MTDSAGDLRAPGNYFAHGDYLQQDLARGLLQNRAGAPMLAVTDEFVISLLNTLDGGLGANADDGVREFGRAWGRRAAEQFGNEMSQYRGQPLHELPVAVFLADLTSAFQEHGWGRVQIELGYYPFGLLCVTMADSFLGSVVKPAAAPVERLLCGFLAGMFSQVAGMELACMQTECRAFGGATSRFVIGLQERLVAVAGWSEAGKSHPDILEELKSMQTTKP